MALAGVIKWITGYDINKEEEEEPWFDNMLAQYNFDDADRESYYQVSAYKLQTGKDSLMLSKAISFNKHIYLSDEVKQKLLLNIIFDDLFTCPTAYYSSHILDQLIKVYPKLNNEWKTVFKTILISPIGSNRPQMSIDNDILGSDDKSKIDELFL